MCLICVAYRSHAQYPLVVVANRDEFYERPSAPARFWPPTDDVLAGRDLREGGMWLGVTRGGRFAAVTNFREPGSGRSDARSRGWLVREFLFGNTPARDYAVALATDGERYNGFNLLLGESGQLFYCSNRAVAPRQLAAGVYGLSNHLLDTPWPKVERAKTVLARGLQGGPVAVGQLLDQLADRFRPADERLPDTGVGLEWERVLAPMFITSSTYGTCSSTVIMVDNLGRVNFVERSFAPPAEEVATRRFEFQLDATGAEHVV
jgi:uncharacterized protein with NRDE domain